MRAKRTATVSASRANQVENVKSVIAGEVKSNARKSVATSERIAKAKQSRGNVVLNTNIAQL